MVFIKHKGSDSLKNCGVFVAAKWQKTRDIHLIHKAVAISNCIANQTTSLCSGAVCPHLNELLCIHLEENSPYSCKLLLLQKASSSQRPALFSVSSELVATAVHFKSVLLHRLPDFRVIMAAVTVAG